MITFFCKRLHRQESNPNMFLCYCCQQELEGNSFRKGKCLLLQGLACIKHRVCVWKNNSTKKIEAIPKKKQKNNKANSKHTQDGIFLDIYGCHNSESCCKSFHKKKDFLHKAVILSPFRRSTYFQQRSHTFYNLLGAIKCNKKEQIYKKFSRCFPRLLN